MKQFVILILMVVVGLIQSGVAEAQGFDTNIIYQGKLLDGGQPAEGLYDFEYSFWDSQVGGDYVPSTLITLPLEVPIHSGIIIEEFNVL